MPSRKPFQDIANLNIKSTNTQPSDIKKNNHHYKTNIANFSFQNLHISTHRHSKSQFLLVNLKVTTSLPNIINLLVKILERKKYKTVWIVMNENLVNELFEKFFRSNSSTDRFNVEKKYSDRGNSERLHAFKSKYDGQFNQKYETDQEYQSQKCNNQITGGVERTISNFKRPFRSILTLTSIFAPLYSLQGYQAHFEYQHILASHQQDEILMYRVERLEKEQ